MLNYERLVWGCITVVLTALAIFGNLVAMVTISTTKNLHTPPIILILFLATADFLMGLLHLLPVSVAWFMDGWLGGPSGNMSANSYDSLNSTIYEASPASWCGISSLFFDIFSSVSLATTVVICLERCYALYFPFSYPRYTTLSSISYACAVGWLISLLFNMPLFMLFKGARYVEPLGQCVPEFSDLGTMQVFLTTRLIFRLSSLIIITVSCVSTIKVVMKHHQISKRCLDMPRKATNQKMIYATMTQILVVALSIITWLPHFFYLYLRIYLEPVSILSNTIPFLMKLRIVVWYMYYLAAVINPIIYSFRLQTVRVAARRRLSMAAVSLDSKIIERIKTTLSSVGGSPDRPPDEYHGSWRLSNASNNIPPTFRNSAAFVQRNRRSIAPSIALSPVQTNSDKHVITNSDQVTNSSPVSGTCL